MKRPGKIEKMIYFDEALDSDLLDHLGPHFEARRGNAELLRLARIGLLLDSRSPAPPPHRPAPPAAPLPAAPRPSREPDPDDLLERARRAAQSDFKFG